jgi:hypothetical protein
MARKRIARKAKELTFEEYIDLILMKRFVAHLSPFKSDQERRAAWEINKQEIYERRRKGGYDPSQVGAHQQYEGQ